MSPISDQPGRLPSVHALLGEPAANVLIVRFGRELVVNALRKVLGSRRDPRDYGASASAVLDEAADFLAHRFSASQRPVFNLTGTVLHTNLGRAPLPKEAAMAAAA